MTFDNKTPKGSGRDSKLTPPAPFEPPETFSFASDFLKLSDFGLTPSEIDEYRRRLSIHEAAHAVVAWHLGFEPLVISIDVDNACYWSQETPLDRDEELFGATIRDEYLSDKIRIRFAGHAADLKNAGPEGLEAKDAGVSSLDFEKADQMLLRLLFPELSNPKDDFERACWKLRLSTSQLALLTGKRKELHHSSRLIVRDNWKQIKRVAERLLEDTTIELVEAAALLQTTGMVPRSMPNWRARLEGRPGYGHPAGVSV